MLKSLSLLIFSGLIVTNSTWANANPAEKKLSLAIFSELQQTRATFPKKSKFETGQQYQDKINDMSVSARPLSLKLSPEVGEYDVEKQQLNLKLKTSSISLDSAIKKEEMMINKKLFNDGSYHYFLDYRRDSEIRSQDTVTCLDEFDVGYKNLHSKKDSQNYFINTLGLNLEKELVLQIPPQEAKEYFQEDETSLNDRLQVRVNLEPVAPFYTTYSQSNGGSCPLGKFAKSLANTYGTTTDFQTNHLIHGQVSYLEIFDRVTGKILYSISLNK